MCVECIDDMQCGRCAGEVVMLTDEVSHDPAGVPEVENRTNWLGEVIRRIDDARNVLNIKLSFPVLYCKELNVDVARPLGGNASIDHVDGTHVVFIDRCGLLLREG